MEPSKQNIFENLSKIQTFPHEEKKGDLTYLSWANAWALVKQNFPDASFRVVTFDTNGLRIKEGLPYQRTDIGYMVWTSVTIASVTEECHLPVMDHRNKAKQAPDILDINNSLMRCLVKNLALFGLGLHIYAGEDIPFGGPSIGVDIDPETGEIIPGSAAAPPKSSGHLTATFAAAIARVGKMSSSEMPNAKRMAPMLFQGDDLERYQAALTAREQELSSPAVISPAASGLPI